MALEMPGSVNILCRLSHDATVARYGPGSNMRRAVGRRHGLSVHSK